MSAAVSFGVRRCPGEERYCDLAVSIGCRQDTVPARGPCTRGRGPRHVVVQATLLELIASLWRRLEQLKGGLEKARVDLVTNQLAKDVRHVFGRMRDNQRDTVASAMPNIGSEYAVNR